MFHIVKQFILHVKTKDYCCLPCQHQQQHELYVIATFNPFTRSYSSYDHQIAVCLQGAYGGGRFVVMATAVEEPQTATPAAQPSQAQPKYASKFVVDESELLTSTAEHRLWTFGSMALMAGADLCGSQSCM